MIKKTYLFFPLEIGMAHIVRSLAVAEELKRLGHNAVVALPKRKQEIFNSPGITMADVIQYQEKDSVQIESIKNINSCHNLIDSELALIKEYNPDAVIVDHRFSAIFSAMIAKKKVFFLSTVSFMPYGSYLPDFKLPKLLQKLLRILEGPLRNLTIKHVLSNLMRAAREEGLRISFRGLFSKMTYILPEPEFYLPPTKKGLRIYFTNPITWKGFTPIRPKWLNKIQPDGRTVYLTFGGTGFHKEKLVELSTSLVKEGFRVVVSTGTVADPRDFPSTPDLFVSKFLPGPEVCKRVDAVVCHGGYGTLIEAVKNGRPAIAIPINPDQVIHSARMDELGVAKAIFSIGFQDLKNAFAFDWDRIESKIKRTGNWQVAEELEKMLEKTKLAEYKRAIDNFNLKYPDASGAIEAAEIITENS